VNRYAELRRWFPTVVSRADAMGVSRETIRRWEANGLAGMSARTQQLVNDLVLTAMDVEDEIGADDTRGVARWMLAPQPAIAGRRVVDLINQGDITRLRLLLYPTVTVPEPQVVPLAQADLALAASPPSTTGRAAVRSRPRSAAKAKALRGLGVRDEMIGPIATALA
jgi:hypothetical protein